MSESASALFSIADAGEFRFARFYSVCEEVPLGTPESPLIVCGLSDTLRECPNVEETRNGMPATAWKKYVNFASKNFPPSVYSGTFLFAGLLIILLIKATHDMLIAPVTGVVPAPASHAPPSHIPGCCGKSLFSPLPSAAARPSPGFRAPAIHPALGCAL